jgi:hypothetical protein
MITDEKHAELNNLMTPIVNYFCMIQNAETIPKDKLDKFTNLLTEEIKVIFETIPKIKEILKPNESKTVNRNENAENICGLPSLDCEYRLMNGYCKMIKCVIL